LDVRAQLASVSHQIAGLAGLQARIAEAESDLAILRKRFPSAPSEMETSEFSAEIIGCMVRSPGAKSPGSERSGGALEAMERACQATEGLARVEERMEVLAERMGHAMHRLGSGEQAAEGLRAQLNELRDDIRHQVVSLRGDLEAQMQSWIARISPTTPDQPYRPHDASSGCSSPVSPMSRSSVERTAQWPTSLIEDSNDCLTRSEDSASSPHQWMITGDQKIKQVDSSDVCSQKGCTSPAQGNGTPSARKHMVEAQRA